MNMQDKPSEFLDEYKKISVTSKIVGLLVQSELSALEAIEILDRAKQTYLERSWHISINKKAD